jgi:glutaredoxin
MLLESKKLPFVEVKIGVDITRDEFMEKFPNARTVPQIIFEGEHIGGYDQLKARLA